MNWENKVRSGKKHGSIKEKPIWWRKNPFFLFGGIFICIENHLFLRMGRWKERREYKSQQK